MTKTEKYQQALEMLTMLIPFKKSQLDSLTLTPEEKQKVSKEYYSLLALKSDYEKSALSYLKTRQYFLNYSYDLCSCGKRKAKVSKNCMNCINSKSKLLATKIIEDLKTGNLTLEGIAKKHGVTRQYAHYIYQKSIGKNYKRNGNK